jgi:hypothetical protein
LQKSPVHVKNLAEITCSCKNTYFAVGHPYNPTTHTMLLLSLMELCPAQENHEKSLYKDMRTAFRAGKSYHSPFCCRILLILTLYPDNEFEFLLQYKTSHKPFYSSNAVNDLGVQLL